MKILFLMLAIVSMSCEAQKLKVFKTVRPPARFPTYIAYFGDSFTDNTVAGGGTTYPVKVAADFPAIPYIKYAIGGTKVCTTTYAPSGGNDLIDRYTLELNKGYSGQLVSFMYGQNDASITNLVNATWKATYKAIIQAFITAGWPRYKLMIIAQPNHSTYWASRALVRQYDYEISQELGILFYDCYQRFVDTGLNDTYFSSSDAFNHPTDAGQVVIKGGYETFLVR